MFESEMYRPPMEYQYIIDDSQNGEFVFYPLFLVIENDKISTQSKGGVWVCVLFYSENLITFHKWLLLIDNKIMQLKYYPKLDLENTYVFKKRVIIIMVLIVVVS